MPELPYDIIYLILTSPNLPRSTLLSSCLVSQLFSSVATPLLYRHVTLGNRGDYKDIWLFFFAAHQSMMHEESLRTLVIEARADDQVASAAGSEKKERLLLLEGWVRPTIYMQELTVTDPTNAPYWKGSKDPGENFSFTYLDDLHIPCLPPDLFPSLTHLSIDPTYTALHPLLRALSPQLSHMTFFRPPDPLSPSWHVLNLTLFQCPSTIFEKLERVVVIGGCLLAPTRKGGPKPYVWPFERRCCPSLKEVKVVTWEADDVKRWTKAMVDKGKEAQKNGWDGLKVVAVMQEEPSEHVRTAANWRESLAS